MKKFWSWVVIVSPIVFSLLELGYLAVTDAMFLDSPLFYNTPFFFMCMLFVFPIGVPLVHSSLTRTKGWHIPVMVASTLLANCTYFFIYALMYPDSGSTRGEAILLYLFSLTVAGSISLISSFIAWLVGYMKYKAASKTTA